MAFAENLALFFDTNGLGVTVMIDGLPVKGIFGSEYVESGFTGSSRPAFTAQTSDLAAVVEDSILIFGGKTFKVKGPKEDDNTGVTTLILELQ